MAATPLLAVSRMSVESLWTHLERAIRLLDPEVVPITAGERKRRHGAYREAVAISRELKTRGVQLSLFADAG